MAANLHYYQDQFEKLINRPGPVNDALVFVEKKTQVKRVYVAYGAKLYLLTLTLTLKHRGVTTEVFGSNGSVRFPLFRTFLTENFNLGIAKMFIIPESPVFLNPNDFRPPKYMLKALKVMMQFLP